MRQRGHCHADLMGAHHPPRFGREHQQHEVDQPEQQHGMRNVMLEQPDHEARVPTEGVKPTDTCRPSYSDSGKGSVKV